MDVDGDARPELLQDTGDGWVVWRWSKTQWISTGTQWPGTSGPGAQAAVDDALRRPQRRRRSSTPFSGTTTTSRSTTPRAPASPPRARSSASAASCCRATAAASKTSTATVSTTTSRCRPTASTSTSAAATAPSCRCARSPIRSRAASATSTIVLLADLNRDGLLDLVKVDLGDVRWFRGLPAGGFDGNAVPWPSPEPLNVRRRRLGNRHRRQRLGRPRVVVDERHVAPRPRRGRRPPACSSASTTASASTSASPTSRRTRCRRRRARPVRRGRREVPMAIPVPVEMVQRPRPRRDGAPHQLRRARRRVGRDRAPLRRLSDHDRDDVGRDAGADQLARRPRYHQGTGTQPRPARQAADRAGLRRHRQADLGERRTLGRAAVDGLPTTEPRLRRAALTDTRGRFEETTPPRETHATYSYDTLGRRIRSRRPGAHRPRLRRRHHRDALRRRRQQTGSATACATRR